MSGLLIQCPSCRHLVQLNQVTLSAGGDRAGLLCSACGTETWLQVAARVGTSGPSAAVASPVNVVAPPAELQRSSSFFTASQRTAMTERLSTQPARTEQQTALNAEFERLLDAWNDEPRHKAFLRHASAEGELAFAGQRYRAVLDASPSDRHAKKAQEDLLALAMTTMSMSRPVDQGRPDRSRLIVMAAVMALACLVLAGVFMSKVLRPHNDDATMGIDPLDGRARNLPQE